MRRDFEHITGSRHVGSSCLDLSALLLPFYIIDFPISLAVDTAALPFILVSDLFFPSSPPPSPPNPER
jgi:hypothetical protein